MKINLEKLSEIYDKGGPLKEILDILLQKAIKNGDDEMCGMFYAFGFYEFEDDELDDDEEILNIPLLLSLNKELRDLILTSVNNVINGKNESSRFFNEFMDTSKIFIPLSEYKQYERKMKLKELEK